MTFIETERKQNEAYAWRQAFFEDVKLDRLADILRELIKLSDMKIELLEKYNLEKAPFLSAVDRNIEGFKRNK